MPKAILIAREDFCYGTILRTVEKSLKQNIIHLEKFGYQTRDEVRFCTTAKIFAKFLECIVPFDALVSSGAESAGAFCLPKETLWVPESTYRLAP
jgi:hypothetical protein